MIVKTPPEGNGENMTTYDCMLIDNNGDSNAVMSSKACLSIKRRPPRVLSDNNLPVFLFSRNFFTIIIIYAPNEIRSSHIIPEPKLSLRRCKNKNK